MVLVISHALEAEIHLQQIEVQEIPYIGPQTLYSSSLNIKGSLFNSELSI